MTGIEDNNAIPEFTRDDYLMTTAPFEWLYRFRDNQFQLRQLLTILSAKAKEVGVKNLASLYKDYLAMVSGQNIVVNSNRTDFTGQELELDCGSWEADDFGIRGTDKLGFEVVACYHPIMPVQRLVNIDTGIHKLKLAYYLGKRWKYILEDRSVLADNRAVVKLAKDGIGVTSESAKHLVRYLSEVEQMNYDLIPEISSVSRLGWIDGYGFSPYMEDLVFDGDEDYRTFFESTKPRGSRQAWMDCCLRARAGRTAGAVVARIALAASFASVLVKPCKCLPFFVHMWGGTETGKTVGAMLAASVWANPELGKYMQTFNATEVGKELGAYFYNSMPLIIDELQLAKEHRKEFDKWIYQLSEGVGRTRGKKGGGLQTTPTWRNCIMSTGEDPIISANSGAGAVNRTIEIPCKEIALFDDPEWTADILTDNYGFAGREFVEKLMEDGVIEEVKAMQDDYQAAIKTESTMSKQTASAALILTADELIERWIFRDGVRLKPEDISPYLASKESVNQNARALQYLHDFISINQARFDPHLDEKGEVWGDMDERYVYFIKSKFDAVLTEEGYSSASFIGWARDHDIIKLAGDGKSTRLRRIRGRPTRCIWLRADAGGGDDLPPDDEDELPL